MKSIVLGFTGRIGSGKTTISSMIAERLGWPRVGFGEYVRKIAWSRGLAESREILQELGESLFSSDPEQFCRAVLAQVSWKQGEPLIIDGIRHVAVVNQLRHLVSPARFQLIYVVLNESVREARLLERDRMDVELLPCIDSHSTERDVRSELLNRADLIVDGSQSKDEIVDQIINCAFCYIPG
jgi:dephospho-CoA kinase